MGSKFIMIFYKEEDKEFYNFPKDEKVFLFKFIFTYKFTSITKQCSY